jgi:hypothetical protein
MEETVDNPKLKKWLNRGGLIAIIVGIVAIVIGGGDTSAALETAGEAAAIAGTIAIFVRELLN